MDRPTRLAVALLSLCLVATAPTVRAGVRYFSIVPGGEYTYLPSPWVGIPGCAAGGYRCDFDVAGAFAIDFDEATNTADFVYGAFHLTGNEQAQADPPNFSPVTASRVADWLGNRSFQLAAPTSPDADRYQEVVISGLELLDFGSGGVRLTGGYNSTFVDGAGIDFDIRGTELAPLAGDFDLDGTLDGGDFLRWQQVDAIPDDLGSLADWLDSVSPTSTFAATVAIPEPNTLVIGLSASAIAFLATRRCC